MIDKWFESSSDGVAAVALRASSYVIYVDLPTDKDEWLLVHGYTGAFDRVNRRIAAFVRSREAGKMFKPLYGEWEPEELTADSGYTPSTETLSLLRKRGYLTEKSPEAELTFFKKLVNQLHDDSLRSAPNYVIMPTYNCNLRCNYCFQDHMRTNPEYRGLLRPMGREMADGRVHSRVYFEPTRMR